ncbi:hypothetical protein QE152_g8493 [Popillia japonica]|uniref:Uncharacterized protein n=1 Tax=Popillia japonica TaxID=7064 RepID=A0AAW1M2Y5_POPJA
MKFYNHLKRYNNLFRIGKSDQQYERRCSTKVNNTEKAAPLKASTSKRPYKPCTSSTPVPCKRIYASKLRLPYYKDLKKVTANPVVETDMTQWNPLKIKPNPRPGIPPDRSNVQMDENLRKAFDDIQKDKIKLCKKYEERLQTTRIKVDENESDTQIEVEDK